MYTAFVLYSVGLERMEGVLELYRRKVIRFDDQGQGMGKGTGWSKLPLMDVLALAEAGNANSRNTSLPGLTPQHSAARTMHRGPLGSLQLYTCCPVLWGHRHCLVAAGRYMFSAMVTFLNWPLFSIV